jgi:copper chaperone
MTRAIIQIEGMSCDHCVRAVKHALAALPHVEVESVLVGRADVRFDETRITPTQLTGAISDAGYSATLNDVRS